MAKKPKSAKATPSKTLEENVAAAVTQLNANYRLGRRLNRGTAPDPTELQSGAVQYLGGVGYSNLRKMQQLAKKVTKENWPKLVKLRLKQNSSPLSWAHWVVLASAPTEGELIKAATQAAKQSWSSTKLRRHLQRAAGTGSRRPGAGRAIRAPGSVAEGLQQLLADVEVVRKRAAALRNLLGNRSGPSGLADNLVVLERAIEAIRTSGAIDL